MKLTAADFAALDSVAAELKIPRDWLIASINFETAGTWDAQKKNPLSSARGLIQFMNSTAVALGYKDSLDLVQKHPTISSQLKGPVLKYFKQFAPFDSKQDFIFSVFLPKYRKAPLDTVIFSDNPTRQKSFRDANPGIQNVGDYFIKLEKSFSRVAKNFKPSPGLSIVGTLAIFALGFIAYNFFKPGAT